MAEFSSPKKGEEIVKTQGALNTVNAAPLMDVEWLIVRAKRGDAVSQQRLAEAYRYGDNELGIKKDLVKACNWYEMLANSKIRSINRAARLFLGARYYFGKGVPESKERAIGLLKNATFWSESKLVFELSLVNTSDDKGPGNRGFRRLIKKALED